MVIFPDTFLHISQSHDLETVGAGHAFGRDNLLRTSFMREASVFLSVHDEILVIFFNRREERQGDVSSQLYKYNKVLRCICICGKVSNMTVHLILVQEHPRVQCATMWTVIWGIGRTMVLWLLLKIHRRYQWSLAVKNS